MKKKNDGANNNSLSLSNKYIIIALFSLQPVVNFASFNVGEAGFSLFRSFLHFLLLFCIGLIFVGISNKILRRISTTNLSLFFGLVVFVTFNGYLIDNFVFENLHDLINITPRIRHVLAIYFLLIIACGLLTYFISRFDNLRSIIIVAFIAIVVTDSISTANSLITAAKINKPFKPTDIIHKAARPSVTAEQNKPKPNVYFILPDMMFGKVMFDKYNIEEDILDGIENRGFRTIKNAFANGPVTYFSLPHIFGMEYYLKDGERISKEKLHGEIRKIFGKGNKVYTEFRKRNYKIFSLDDGYLPSNCKIGEDLCIHKPVSSFHSQQDLRFLERTPLLRALDVVDMKFNIFSTPLNLWAFPNRVEIPDLLDSFPDPDEGPFFFYIHIGLPHYPLRFDENCNYTRFDDTAIAYSQQYKCGVKYIELLLDTILEKDKDALIVIQSDHGVSFPGQHLKQVEELQFDEIQEVLSIYSAFKLPDNCSRYLHDDLTPVNTFRIVFACLDNKEPELLDDKSYLVFYPKWPSGGKVREWHR